MSKPKHIWDAINRGDWKHLSNAGKKAAKTKQLPKTSPSAPEKPKRPLSNLEKHMSTDDYKHIMSWHDEDMLKQAVTKKLYQKALISRLTNSPELESKTISQLKSISNISSDARIRTSAEKTLTAFDKIKQAR